MDLMQIQRDIESVIKYSQEYPFDVDMHDIVNQWYRSKKFFIDTFGGQPIKRITKEPLSFTLSPQEKGSIFTNMIDDIEQHGQLFSYNEEEDYTLNDFLHENETGFFNNRVVVDHPSLKIRKNMKLLKCFKYFLPDFTTTRNIQDVASRYIQEDRITGHLYLSVHPLDFLSMSENNCGWRTCQSLDGDFRAGVINYMLDDTTFMAYLADEEDDKLRPFPDGMLWNSKKWRVLLHTNQFESIIYYNRQYPYNSDTLLACVHQYIYSHISNGFRPPETIGFKHFKVGRKEVDSTFNYIYMPERQCIYDTRETIDESGSLGYTDLCYSSDFVPMASTLQSNLSNYHRVCFEADSEREDWDKAFHEEFDISIGKRYKCLKCGSGDLKRFNSFLCEDCIVEEDLDEDNYMKCDCCGRRIYPDDQFYDIDEEKLCETCYDAIKNSKKET